MRLAGPVRLSSEARPGQATLWTPPGATTVRGDVQPWKAMAAAAAAEVPVPEELVGPTPRSKMRISMREGESMRTNSTLVW